jgi:hypothetical protein
MSRDVRRVPVDWKHPIEHNPNWAYQASIPIGRTHPPSRMHGRTEQFKALYGKSVSVAQKEWDDEREQWDAGTHEDLIWQLEYHSKDGWVDGKGERREPNPYKVYDETGNTVIRWFYPTSVAEIVAVYPYEDYAGKRPTAADYMPDFDVPEDELGWCLYETVSEGTPVTPVFATAAELVDHLCTVGQDWDQEPMRRASAEAIVNQGGTFGTMLVQDGHLYRSDVDADLIAAMTKPATP